MPRTSASTCCASTKPLVVPRVADVYAAIPAITGKFELEYEGELKGADAVARDLIRSAVLNVATGYFRDADARGAVRWFDGGGSLQLSDTTGARDLVDRTREIEGLHETAGDELGQAGRQGAHRAARHEHRQATQHQGPAPEPVGQRAHEELPHGKRHEEGAQCGAECLH